MVAPVPPVPRLDETFTNVASSTWSRWFEVLRSRVVEGLITLRVMAANGFSGAVVVSNQGNGSITITTTVTGLLKGDGTGVAAAVAGTDYTTPAGLAAAIAPKLTATSGTSAAMVSGTVTVANTTVTAGSVIIGTRKDGGLNAGAVYESARVVGVSFTFTSTNVLDTGAVSWILV